MSHRTSAILKLSFHCSMYILMRGKVTIYILYAKKGDDDEKDQAPTIAEKEGKEVNIRQQLGTYVCSLGKKIGYNGNRKSLLDEIV